MADDGGLSGLSGLTRSAGLRIDDWGAWWNAVTRPGALGEIALIAACGLLAWGLAALLHRAWTRAGGQSRILLGGRGIDGALFPLMWLGLAWLARLALLRLDVAAPLMRVALPALMALAVIRVGVKVLQAAFPDAQAVRVLERTISWLVWAGLVLWLSGLLPVLLEEAETVSWKVGGASVTLRSLIEGAVNVALALLLALWLSSVIEARLLRDAGGANLSLRKVVANALRALLILVAVLVALTAVGIDLTALSVMSGAIGVGIGLGLQKLAANYVSGFVVLAERALRIGDAVRVDGFEGEITDIRARYTVIRAATGRRSIVPNEMMVTQRVENLSLADRRVAQSTVVSVDYGADADLVARLLRQAAQDNPRVLREPAPSTSLSAFGADGLEFTVGYWTNEPEARRLGLRSEINVAILAALSANGIHIPFSQRMVHYAPPPGVAPQE
ncbi:mechanosensitive ion channel domain-containing protein [Ottowia sp.]|uniref:mechanosensitive ion channel family protein n=1 Tax=Ottowia sp. TaxID=1898956 RepID=UPI0025F81BDD|nr:mechanosensitive ion channel domain-containing protein [Ottowia sp.]MBK6613167.1 mechanosensitive ion channel [Ottowia sp.]MBK6747722.1 mechanosensitive ion channel [Ottowia sp.]